MSTNEAAQPDRRQFLVQLTGAAVTIAAAASLTSGVSGCADPGSITGGGGPLTVDVSGLTANGQALVTSTNGPDGGPVLIVRQGAAQFVAYSMVCTHQGCILDDPTSSGVLFCPCHGSEFDLQGQVLRGPASRALARFTVAFDATTNKVTIS